MWRQGSLSHETSCQPPGPTITPILLYSIMRLDNSLCEVLAATSDFFPSFQVLFPLVSFDGSPSSLSLPVFGVSKTTIFTYTPPFSISVMTDDFDRLVPPSPCPHPCSSPSRSLFPSTSLT